MAEDTEIHVEILEAALSELEEGIAVLDGESRVLFWNSAAAAITGHQSAELLSRSLPTDFYQIDAHHHASSVAAEDADHERMPIFGSKAAATPAERPALVHLRHRQGHSLPAMLRRTPLRNALGKRFGTLLRFHPMEEIDALPHGVTEENGGQERRVEESQAGMEDRLDEAWCEWTANAVPFGLLWITVDQAAMLRKTHGRDASEAMLAIVERTLLHGLRPAEVLGRWGANEFLVLSHERTAEMLKAHAHRVGGLARTADFRWWGDRVSLTVSIGAAQAAEADTLRSLLKRAQHGMEASAYAGGNLVTTKSSSTEEQECSQS
jgi:diguanylate cyclase (GGDEF)-like protein/PAS domain S-box-containing protein